MAENMQNKRGRPKKADADRRDSKIEVRVTAAELEKYRQSAGGRPVSEFLRGLADMVGLLELDTAGDKTFSDVPTGGVPTGGYDPATGGYSFQHTQQETP